MGHTLSYQVDRHVEPFDVDPNEVTLQSTDLDVISELHHKNLPSMLHEKQIIPQDHLQRKIEIIQKTTDDPTLQNYPMMPPPEIHGPRKST